MSFKTEYKFLLYIAKFQTHRCTLNHFSFFCLLIPTSRATACLSSPFSGTLPTGHSKFRFLPAGWLRLGQAKYLNDVAVAPCCPQEFTEPTNFDHREAAAGIIPFGILCTINQNVKQSSCRSCSSQECGSYSPAIRWKIEGKIQ